jgi:hypothetical protein
MLPSTSRVERINMLRRYYLTFLVEDSVDGTGFDINILNLLDGLESHYKDNDDDNRTIFRLAQEVYPQPVTA